MADHASQRSRKGPLTRFWEQVEIRPSTEECWPWRGTTTVHGYGAFGRELAHRFSCEMVHGPLTGMIVRHTCDVPLCVNPHHLVPGTHAENVADRVARFRSARGTRNGRAKLAEAQVIAIRAATGRRVDIARRYRVDPALISAIKAGRLWRHIPTAESTAE